MSSNRQSALLSISSLLLLVLLVSTLEAQQDKKPQDKKPRYTDPAKADKDFSFQGEYAGDFLEGSTVEKIGFQVIALGDGKFDAVAYRDGLPGDGWNQQDKMPFSEGTLKDGVVTFSSPQGTITIKDGELEVVDTDGDSLATIKKVERKSKTLGEKPPEGAVVLFDGSNADEWKNGKVENKLLVQGTTSKKTFGSHKLHIEFRLPYMPKDRKQGRGNSGIYVQGKYEVQMLDSFGLEGKQNECGGIYSVKDCDLNMCYPPLSWQTFDIEYTAAKYEDGKLVASPQMTIYHNGVKIHDNVELPGDRNTTAAPVKAGPDKGPIYLQNHGCPIRYRNVWVVEKD